MAVENFVFQGASALAMDAKGRWAVPTRHREVLQGLSAGQMTVTKHPHGCLMVFPRPAWEAFRDKVAALSMESAGWKRLFLGNAQDLEIDSAGRVLISPELRLSAGLDKGITLLGMGSYFELWDTARYEAQEAALLLTEMPNSLKDLSF